MALNLFPVLCCKWWQGCHGHGLKLKKLSQPFQLLMLCLLMSPNKVLWLVPSDEIGLISPKSAATLFVWWLLWSKTAISSWHSPLSPFKPQYSRTNSPNWSQYISIKNKLREFDKRSKPFPSGDYCINSHNLFSWLCIDIGREKIDVCHSWELKG